MESQFPDKNFPLKFFYYFGNKEEYFTFSGKREKTRKKSLKKKKTLSKVFFSTKESLLAMITLIFLINGFIRVLRKRESG